LQQYKTEEDGYEWFGDSPASEVLSAYGLMQFTDMEYAAPSSVDRSTMARLTTWLMKRRDTKGAFILNPEALDNFGRAPENVTNAYILWALTSANVTEDLTLEINAIKALAD